MKNDKYEISLWEDVYINAAPGVPAHYEEQKIAVIGSNTMTAPCRAFEPKLVENVNGTNTFTFTIYYKYKDYEFKNGEYNDVVVDNPFSKFLTNERKVKVLWKNKWYDLIINNCQENSEKQSITYTCNDAFITELSKSGFNLEFDTDLENNQGTIIELGEKVVKGTDWVIDTANSDIITQENEEPVYEATLRETVSFHNETRGGTESILEGSKILIYYNQVADIIQSTETEGTLPKFQIAYALNYVTELNYQKVINADCYSLDGVRWEKTYDGQTLTAISFIDNSEPFVEIGFESNVSSVSNKYRATRLVSSQLCKKDPITDQYCGIYKAKQDSSDGSYKKGDEIYEYETTQYNDVTVINNLIVNSKNFSNTSGWVNEDKTIQWQLYFPNPDKIVGAKSYLSIPNGQTYNNALQSSINYLKDGVVEGQTFVFKGAFVTNDGENYDKPSPLFIDDPDNLSCDIVDKGGTSHIQNWSYVEYDEDTHFLKWTFEFSNSFTKQQIYDDLKFVIRNNKNELIWLQEAQLYPLVYGLNSDGQTVELAPGEMDKVAIAKKVYRYYNHTKTIEDGIEDIEDVVFIEEGSSRTTNSDWEMVMNPDFVKIRSISAKQSNRFNLLQTLAETFQCWIKFIIDHNENTGQPIYENGKPKKRIVFKKEIGEETGIGFVYGIDLKTIQRTTKSDQLVTKTIVQPNSNEFAKNGVCTIIRSEDNYPKVNYILNFDYFTSQGLLDPIELNNDLYLMDSEDYIGYFANLNKFNTQYLNDAEEISNLNNELLHCESTYKTYSGLLSSAEESLEEKKGQAVSLAKASSFYKDDNVTLNDEVKKLLESDQSDLQTLRNAIVNLTNQVEFYSPQVENLETLMGTLKNKISTLEDGQSEKIEQIEELDKQFNSKYANFIREGSWSSKDYIDDNLYYLDAKKVAYTSARPQVTYTISVLRLSALEDFKNKVFRLGDIAFIQDKDFFGYMTIDGVKTPYKEKVLVSEVTSNFDSPEKDSFKVQNYRTQFDDLFKRISSSVQSLKYASGDYARAASVVQTDGTIKPATLQGSINENYNLVFNSHNNTISQNRDGISITDLSDSNQRLQISAGGIFISNDGGRSWRNAINGRGITTELLTAGAINSNQITIFDGENPSFKWDATGINAYSPNSNGGINNGKFVRFDRFGIYGMDLPNDVIFKPSELEDVESGAKFGLTWDGFFLKNEDGVGGIEISNKNDIYVYTGSGTSKKGKIKIGKIGETYGITIYDSNENAVFKTDDNGNLQVEGKVTAKSGSIGGFIINEDDLTSKAKTNNNEPFITLDGTSGEIKACNLKIGTGAEIGAEVTIGDKVQLRKPDISNTTFLSVKKDGTNNIFSITSEGKLNIGSITINGDESTIYGESYTITPELATFKNICATGKITSAVFETGHVQAVGGAMIFSPSYKVKSFKRTGNNIDITLDSEYLGSNGDYIYLVGDDGKIKEQVCKILSVARETITISSFNMSFDDLFSIISIGKNNSLVIGVNSTEAAMGKVLQPKGFSFTEMSVKEVWKDLIDSDNKVITEDKGGVLQFEEIQPSYTPNYTPKLFLGDLTNNVYVSKEFSKPSGYGLYCDNVYLKGSIVTKNEGQTYSGIDTKSDIVFWAGARGSDLIEDAPFKVHSDGSIYATKGIFEGTIRAARIEGYDNSTEANLVFYNADKGITFLKKDTDNNKEVPVFTIGTNGMYFGGKVVDDDSSNYFISLKDQNFSLNFGGLAGDAVKLCYETNSGFTLKGGDVNFKNNNVKFSQGVTMGEKMRYIKTANGYDLYVDVERQV